MDPGKLKDRVQILHLEQSENELRWNVFKNTWAQVEYTSKTNYFSKVGIGVLSVKFTMRRQVLSLHDALCFRGRHYFITGITPVSNLHMEVETAKIEPIPCILYDNETELDSLNRPTTQKKNLLTFPGCLVEKYMGYTAEKSHGESEISFVLVTPKQVSLDYTDVGKLVEIGGKPYHVLICHELDEYKNEYEVTRKEDG